MNQEPSAVWPSLGADAGDDFSFLELPDLNLDFPALDEAAPSASGEASLHATPQLANGQPQRPSVSQSGTQEGLLAGLKDGVNGLSHRMEGVEVPTPVGRASAAQQKQSDAQLLAQYRQQPPQHPPSYHAQAAAHFYGPGRVPPTPNSMEMHGMHRHFSVADHQQAQALYEAYSRKQQEQVRTSVDIAHPFP